MKSYTFRFRATDKHIFDDILSGKKKVETRAASVRYKNIQQGDRITLVCGTKKETKIVSKAKIYKTLTGLLKDYSVKDIAPTLTTRAELEALYNSFGGYSEKLKHFGFLAIEFK